MNIEGIPTENVLTPIAGTGFGTVFTVGSRSVVCKLTTPSGSVLGVAAAFELHAVLDYNRTTKAPTRSYPIVELDRASSNSYKLTMGTDNTQAEVMLRGVYVWEKVLATVPLVGVEILAGYEKTL